MRIVLIHGYKSSSKLNFFPWLSAALKNNGHDVVVPDLPNPNEPDPEEWTKALLEEVGVIDDETIIVGHSLGGAAALRFLEAAQAHSTPRGCLLISTPWMIQSEKFRGFFMSALDFEVLMWKASLYRILHAKDDDVIPFDHAQKYADVLHGKLIEAESGGHFKGEQYPQILEAIEELIAAEIIYQPGQSLDNDYAEILI